MLPVPTMAMGDALVQGDAADEAVAERLVADLAQRLLRLVVRSINTMTY